MPFVQPDEFIILFDYANPGPWYAPLTLWEKVAFGKAGIRTVYYNLNWDEIEVAPGKFDWDKARMWIIEARMARLKVLFGIGDRMPTFYPPEWYCAGPKGRDTNYIYTNYFSPWHPEAQARLDWFIKEAVRKLAAPDVLLIKSGAHSGECLLSPMPAYYDAAAVESWQQTTRNYNSKPELLPLGRRDLSPPTRLWLKNSLLDQAVRQQAILVEQPSREIWSNLHPCFYDDLMSGNEYAEILYERYWKLNPSVLNGFTFGYYWITDYLKALQAEIAMHSKMNVFVGSEYCEGLIANTDSAISTGLRGFVTGPLCTDRGHNPDLGRCQPWMYEAVADSLKKWRAARL